MKIESLESLIRDGEGQNVDFKITCNAFLKDKKANAELVKDIIAFSNNGNTLNFIIIGISDDRLNYRNVDNEKITDDNLQVLVKDNIYPVPCVKIERIAYKPSDCSRSEKINLVIIHIGRQARQCFRFARDHIDYAKEYCFKRNEVWIRRRAISDLASPEEVKRLVEGKPPVEIGNTIVGSIYSTFSKYEFREKILEDIIEYTIEKNYEIFNVKGLNKYGQEEKYNILKVNSKGISYSLLVLIIEKSSRKFELAQVFREISVIHHGILVICKDGFAKSSLIGCPLICTERWGTFTANELTRSRTDIKCNVTAKREDLLANEYDSFSMILPNIKNTTILYEKLEKAIMDLFSKEYIVKIADKLRTDINKTLEAWLANGCPVLTGKILFTGEANYDIGSLVEELKDEEYIDKKLSGNKILKNDKNKQKEIKLILK